jgi:hypothetical protein
MDTKMLEELKDLASEKTIGDEQEAGEDVVVDDYAGGNVDDAYWKGHNDGQIDLARQLLKTMSLWTNG